ncbi:hypothetical protein HYH03_001466 [Edaphochlamys debaryana]|uniref:Uncharacterized protein n=1 Tax=Edaphochlamys debaryana TaxID=47281 RepID=A0A835YDQ2_9CHLO|nr:hypothetical protein HYH03_001466 [Edaphochlamys debaryana]|eukprot:KAG2500701.1 hypothetical protein HYH03_001466 [Edaphochlamys debaryana]
MGSRSSKVVDDDGNSGSLKQVDDDKAGSGRLVDLKLAALDVYEYYGLGYLILRVLFWIFLVLAFFNCYTREQIVNSSNVVAHVSAFGPEEWHNRQVRDQASMSDALSYVFDLGASILANASASAANEQQQDLAQDTDFLARYSSLVELEVVTDYTLFPGKLAWLAVLALRDADLQTVRTVVATLDLYGDKLVEPTSFVLMGIVLAFSLAYLGVLLRSIWLYDLQRQRKWKAPGAVGEPGREPPRKAGWAWCIATYFIYSLWNLYLISASSTIAGTYLTGADHMTAALSSDTNLNKLLLWGCYTAAWYQIGAFALLLNGLSLYPYFRVHRGLRLYLHVLNAAWKALLDFLAFFAYIFLLIGFFCLATTQLPGVQPDLTYPSTAFAALAKLMLGFYSYEQFVNDAVPKAMLLTAVQEAVFWISVIMLFILVQNILLAIVAVAYDEAKLAEGTADASFLFVLLLRATWYPVAWYYRLWRRMQWHEVAVALHHWPTSTFSLYYKRWAAYYTFYLNWHFKPRSPWLHNPFRVSRRKEAARRELPPDSISAPLTHQELASSLLALGATPSFQRLIALKLPWPLHHVRAYEWNEGSLQTLAQLLWLCYTFDPAEEGREGGGREGGGNEGGGGGRWFFKSAALGAGALAASASRERREAAIVAAGEGGSDGGSGRWRSGGSEGGEAASPPAPLAQGSQPQGAPPQIGNSGGAGSGQRGDDLV